MSEDKSQDRPKGLTRREFLEKAVKAGLGVAAGTIGSGPLVAGLQKPAEKIRSQSLQSTASPPTTLDVSTVTPENTVTLAPEKAETQPTKPIQPRKELFFVNTQDKALPDAEQRIGDQVVHYRRKEKDLQGRINRTLRYKDMVMSVARRRGFKQDSPVPELLLGLIFVESGGNPDAIAGKPNRRHGEKMEIKDIKRARGLCQVRPNTAREVAERLSLRISDNSLFDPQTNITLALEYLDHLYNKLFPDLGIAFWAYHLGEGNMTAAIETYLTEELRVPKATVDAVLSNKERAGTFNLAKDYNLTFLKLINSQKVREKLKTREAFNDDTKFYVPRIGAAMRLLGL